MNSKIVDSISRNPETIKLWSQRSDAERIISDAFANGNVKIPSGLKEEKALFDTLVRTWICIINDTDEVTAISVALEFSKGTDMSEIIGQAKVAYDSFANGETAPDGNLFAHILTVDSIHWSDMATSLLFLTRYTPTEAMSEKLTKKTLNEFNDLQKSLRGMRFDESTPLYPSKFIKPMAEAPSKDTLAYSKYMSELIDELRTYAYAFPSRCKDRHPAALDLIRNWLLEELRDNSPFWIDKHFDELFYQGDFTDCFTPGSTSDAGRCKFDKVASVSLLGSKLFGEYASLLADSYPSDDELTSLVRDTPMNVMAVPKNYEKRRIIAPCSVLQAKYGRDLFKVSSLIIKVWNDSRGLLGSRGIRITYLDQSENRDLAYRGSLNGDYDTLDLKNASDRNRESVLDKVWPQYTAFQRGRIPEFYQIPNPDSKSDDDKYLRFPLGSYMLAGDPNTYNTECLYFSIGVAYAIDLVDRYVDTGVNDIKAVICGDDIVCHHAYTDTVIDVLTVMGCVVNTDKSFCDTSTLFRESCGGFYKNGFGLNPVYVPRQKVEFSDGKLAYSNLKNEWYSSVEYRPISSLGTMVSLANDIVRYPRAWFILVEFIFEHTDEKLTASDSAWETGLRTPYLFIERKQQSPYGSISEEVYSLEWRSRTSRSDGNGDILKRAYYSSSKIKSTPKKDCPADSYINKYWTDRPDDMYSSRMSAYQRGVDGGYDTNDVEKLRVWKIVDWFRYQNYLKFGPSYDDELMRTLNVSSRRKF